MKKSEISARTRHFLFVCSANRNRSRAAEQVCTQLARAKGRDIQCESAGIHPLAVRRVTRQMADRAGMIFVMEPYMKTIIERDFGQPGQKIVCLDIPDIYPMEDPELEAILRSELLGYI
jgi:predicted protein tyrosine phosphatase